MRAESVTHGSFTIVRQYPASPEKVFGAFSDPAKKRRWFAESTGFHVDSFEMDFRVGGVERARFRFTGGRPIVEGTPCANDTVYLDIVPGRRIVLAYTMTVAGARISSSLGTTEFLADGGGTKLLYTEHAAFFEGADGKDMRQQGTEELLGRLGQLLDGAL